MKIAGFWIRLLSDGLDALLLAALGWCIYWIAPQWVHRLGDHAALVGLLMSFVYVSGLTSSIGHGQTLGKRLTRTRVLTTDGAELSLPKAMLRYLPVAFAFYLGAFETVLTPLVPPAAEVAVTKLLSVLWLVTLLGLVFMTVLHPAKRGLHDLMANTVVVRAPYVFDRETFTALNMRPTSRGLRVLLVIACLLLVGGIGGVATVVSRAQSDDQQALRQAWDTMRTDPALRVTAMKLIRNTATSAVGDESFTLTTVLVIAKPPIESDDGKLTPTSPIVEQLFRSTYDNLPDSLRVDVIHVAVVTGFHLGIAKRITTTTFAEDHADPATRRQLAAQTRY